MRLPGVCACRVYVLLASVSCLLAMASWATAQEAAKKDTKPEDKTLQAADRWPLKVTYYPSSSGKSAAVVLLLHSKGESRRVWTAPKGFAEDLQRLGYAVIALDLRKHGESKPDADGLGAIKEDKSTKKGSGGSDLKPADFSLMINDLEVVKRFIYDEHQSGNLNMRKMAIVAPEMSAPIALAFTVNDWSKKPFDDASTAAARTPKGQDVQALVLLSPETSLPNLQTHQMAPILKATPLAAMLFVGDKDSDKEKVHQLYSQLGGETPKPGTKKPDPKKSKDKDSDKDDRQRIFFAPVPGKLRGTNLLGQSFRIEDLIAGFLNKHLQKLEGPDYEWRDRKSRLQD